MTRFLKIATSGILLLTFTLFNVGVPVVVYLCPLMSTESPVCDLSPAKGTDRPSITNQVPDCCAKIIVAERKTTPFEKVRSEFRINPQAVALEPVAASNKILSSALIFAPISDTGPPGTSQPLFLLNSSLLI